MTIEMKSKALQLTLALLIMFFLSACSGKLNGVPEPRPSSKASIEAGRRLIIRYGCGACHSIPGVPGARTTVGPPLAQFYEQTYIAGQLPNTEENLIRWIQNPQQIVPGDAMPDLGVTADEAKDIAAYLYDPPSIQDLIAH
jgi:cytochrome c